MRPSATRRDQAASVNRGCMQRMLARMVALHGPGVWEQHVWGKGGGGAFFSHPRSFWTFRLTLNNDINQDCLNRNYVLTEYVLNENNCTADSQSLCRLMKGMFARKCYWYQQQLRESAVLETSEKREVAPYIVCAPKQDVCQPRMDMKNTFKCSFFWCSIGTGKTMLMDLFYDATCVDKKRRAHFNAFMLEVHKRKCTTGLAWTHGPGLPGLTKSCMLNSMQFVMRKALVQLMCKMLCYGLFFMSITDKEHFDHFLWISVDMHAHTQSTCMHTRVSTCPNQGRFLLVDFSCPVLRSGPWKIVLSVDQIWSGMGLNVQIACIC